MSPNPTIAADASSGPRSGRVYVVWGSTSLNQSQDVYVAAFDPDLRPLLGVRPLKQVNPPEGFPGPDQFLPSAALDQTNGDLWACYYQSLGSARRRARFVLYGASAPEPLCHRHRPPSPHRVLPITRGIRTGVTP